MEVYIWSKAFGLPSFDTNSLTVMAHCKFAKINANFVETRIPWKSPSYELPYLKDNDGVTVSGLQEILDHCHLGDHGDGNEAFTGDFFAMSAWLEEKLRPAVEHYTWVDTLNFTEFIRPWYAHATVFPLSMVIPTNIHKNITNKLYYKVGDKYLSDKDREYIIYKDAKECITLLSSVLDKKDFFHGKTPSTTDALVFGYLAPILKAPFPNTSLQQHIKNCPNLTAFCQRILDQYFPYCKQDEELYKQDEEKQTKENRESETEFPNRKRNGIITAVFAISAMVLYAFASGLIAVEIEDEEEEEEYEHEEEDND